MVKFTDGMLISGFQNIVDKKLIDIPFELTEKNIGDFTYSRMG